MTTVDVALVMIRLVLGITFILHGGQKLFGWFGGSGMKGTIGFMAKLGVAHPRLLAWSAALSEFGGGALVGIGLITPLAAAIVASTMVVAIATVHGKNGFFATNRGYEYNLSLIVLSVTLMLLGGGALSLDRVFGIAYRFDQLPGWMAVILVLVPFSGLIATEISKRLKATGHAQTDNQLRA